MGRTELKKFRCGKLLTQEQFAQKLGYSRGQYARFEDGKAKVTLRFLEALQTAFDISFDAAKKLTKLDNK